MTLAIIGFFSVSIVAALMVMSALRRVTDQDLAGLREAQVPAVQMPLVTAPVVETTVVSTARTTRVHRSPARGTVTTKPLNKPRNDSRFVDPALVRPIQKREMSDVAGGTSANEWLYRQ